MVGDEVGEKSEVPPRMGDGRIDPTLHQLKNLRAGARPYTGPRGAFAARLAAYAAGGEIEAAHLLGPEHVSTHNAGIQLGREAEDSHQPP